MSEPKIRLDKWLWHARFFKTRTLAAKVVSGGHVRVNANKRIIFAPKELQQPVRVKCSKALLPLMNPPLRVNYGLQVQFV